MLKEEIYFSDDKIFKIISDILWKNGIDEMPVDSADKILQKKDSYILIVYGLLIDLAKQKISEKEFLDLLQSKAKISSHIAQNILQEAKKNILPYSEKVTVDVEQEEKRSALIGVPTPIARRTEKKPLPITDKRTRPNSNTIKNIERLPEIKKNQRSGTDNYREPID